MKAAGLIRLMLAVVVSGLVAAQALAMTDAQRNAIAERIKPAGSVCIEGDTSCASTSGAVVGSAAAARSGKEVYDASCLACHATGAAGAPLVGDKADWIKRMANGIDTVYTNAIDGLNGMPAMGLCMTCSKDEIRAAVDYMVENSQ